MEKEIQPVKVANVNGSYNYLESSKNYWAPLESQVEEVKGCDPEQEVERGVVADNKHLKPMLKQKIARK